VTKWLDIHIIKQFTWWIPFSLLLLLARIFHRRGVLLVILMLNLEVKKCMLNSFWRYWILKNVTKVSSYCLTSTNALGDTQFCLYVPATAAKKCCSSIPIYTPRSPDHRNASQYSSQRVTTASHYKTAILKLFPTRLEQNFPVLWYQKKRVTSTSSGSQETDQMKKKERKKTCNNEMQTEKQTGQVNVGQARNRSRAHSPQSLP
jgi:hypothetical protein